MLTRMASTILSPPIHVDSAFGVGAPIPCNTDALSRSLVRLLRHGAAREGLELRADGYANLSDVLRVPSIAKHGPTVAAVEHVVRICPKQRLGLCTENGSIYIRANQGHTLRSVHDEELLTRVTDPEVSNPFDCY